MNIYIYILYILIIYKLNLNIYTYIYYGRQKSINNLKPLRYKELMELNIRFIRIINGEFNNLTRLDSSIINRHIKCKKYIRGGLWFRLFSSRNPSLKE